MFADLPAAVQVSLALAAADRAVDHRQAIWDMRMDALDRLTLGEDRTYLRVRALLDDVQLFFYRATYERAA
jgi:hypothetical protein